MKTILSILIALILLVGCRSTKKLTESSAVISNQTETVQKADVKEETKINNDKSSYKKTTITETEFVDVSKPHNESNASDKSSELPEAKRAVKVIKVTVIEEGTSDKTKTETKKVDNSEIKSNTEDRTKTEIKSIDEKSVPIQWGWIFGIFVLGFITFVYFSKSKIATVVKTFIKKLFV